MNKLFHENQGFHRGDAENAEEFLKNFLCITVTAEVSDSGPAWKTKKFSAEKRRSRNYFLKYSAFSASFAKHPVGLR